jgi:hypothetical protein
MDGNSIVIIIFGITALVFVLTVGDAMFRHAVLPSKPKARVGLPVSIPRKRALEPGEYAYCPGCINRIDTGREYDCAVDRCTEIPPDYDYYNE